MGDFSKIGELVENLTGVEQKQITEEERRKLLYQSELIKADTVNKSKGDLTGYNCKDCLNRGYFIRVRENGTHYSEPCSCMEVRKSLREIEKSGLKNMLEEYTLEKWVEEERWQMLAKQMILKYVENEKGWMFFGGNPGIGKTHLCTAACNLLLQKKFPVKYVIWKNFGTKAKGSVMDSKEYDKLVRPMLEANVLYIDDFFKTKKGEMPSSGDVNLAFEIINYRYNDRNKMTIISSERTIKQIAEVDEAIGSRIYERSKGFTANLTKAENWRLKH